MLSLMFRNSASTSTTEVSVLYSQLRARTTPVASSIKKNQQRFSTHYKQFSKQNTYLKYISSSVAISLSNAPILLPMSTSNQIMADASTCQQQQPDVITDQADIGQLATPRGSSTNKNLQ